MFFCSSVLKILCIPWVLCETTKVCVCLQCLREGGRRHGMTSLSLLCVPLSFRQKNIFPHADDAEIAETLALIFLFHTECTEHTEFYSPCSLPIPHGARRSYSPFCVFRAFCVRHKNSACVCGVCVPKICSFVKIIWQKRRGALRSSLHYLLCVPI